MSAIPLETGIPSGQYPPFAAVTDNDHRAWIIIAAAMGISFMLMALVARVLIRKFVNLGWALDDTILTISTGVAFVEASLILSACADGLGTSIKLISPELQARIQKFLRWEVQGAISCLFEVAIFAAPVWLVVKLHKPLETKVEIVAPFALRLLIIVLTGLRLSSFDQAAFATDPTLRESRYISWTQAEMSYAIIGATIPTARRLVLDLITFYNGGYFGSTISESGTRSGTYQMNKLRSRVQRNSELTSARAVEDAACDDGDNGSQEMIIRKDVTVEVKHEQGKSEPGDHVNSALKTHIVKGGHGFAFEVEKGQHFRVVDVYGEQVTDLVAWVKGTNLVEKLSMAHTRFHLIGVPPEKGEYLWTNKDDPIFQVVDDTVRVHDMTFASCFPEMYEKEGRLNHRSCAGNIAEVMKPYGMRSYLEVPDPFNIFMNTPNYTLKRLNPSKPGDYIEFKAMKDVIIAGQRFLKLKTESARE
ncbi:hypothetical protein DV736_g3890, partial [Chaetothyriales sp. CBS 134916]